MNKFKTFKAIFNMVRYIVSIVLWFDMVSVIAVSFATGGEAVRGNENLLSTLQWLTLIGVFIAVMRIVKIVFDAYVDLLVERKVSNNG